MVSLNGWPPRGDAKLLAAAGSTKDVGSVSLNFFKTEKKKSFHRRPSLRTKAEFSLVTKWGIKYTGEFIIAYGLAKSDCRLGIAVSRHYGKAHLRNQFKRRVREAFRQSASQFLIPYHLIIKPGSLAQQAKTADMTKELLAFFGKKAPIPS